MYESHSVHRVAGDSLIAGGSSVCGGETPEDGQGTRGGGYFSLTSALLQQLTAANASVDPGGGAPNATVPASDRARLGSLDTVGTELTDPNDPSRIFNGDSNSMSCLAPTLPSLLPPRGPPQAKFRNSEDSGELRLLDHLLGRSDVLDNHGSEDDRRDIVMTLAAFGTYEKDESGIGSEAGSQPTATAPATPTTAAAASACLEASYLAPSIRIPSPSGPSEASPYKTDHDAVLFSVWAGGSGSGHNDLSHGGISQGGDSVPVGPADQIKQRLPNNDHSIPLLAGAVGSYGSWGRPSRSLEVASRTDAGAPPRSSEPMQQTLNPSHSASLVTTISHFQRVPSGYHPVSAGRASGGGGSSGPSSRRNSVGNSPAMSNLGPSQPLPPLLSQVVVPDAATLSPHRLLLRDQPLNLLNSGLQYAPPSPMQAALMSARQSSDGPAAVVPHLYRSRSVLPHPPTSGSSSLVVSQSSLVSYNQHAAGGQVRLSFESRQDTFQSLNSTGDCAVADVATFRPPQPPTVMPAVPRCHPGLFESPLPTRDHPSRGLTVMPSANLVELALPPTGISPEPSSAACLTRTAWTGPPALVRVSSSRRADDVIGVPHLPTSDVAAVAGTSGGHLSAQSSNNDLAGISRMRRSAVVASDARLDRLKPWRPSDI